ncbi:hypothetical protein EVG20_g4543 [Dentipellis fragilis]|uniref:ABM domain-containing protein n=1 Tax=Dentipellis fragilis TaxID=205917 RepID=A0A4Y9YYA2_9AGAM|nr:hypothetical protein EVG20_g4543 [Dentipellis fragilis]
MPSTLEIASWPASESYQKDSAIINEFAAATVPVAGVQSVFTGLQVEKPNGYLVVAWDNYEAHQRVAADKKKFTANARKLVPAMAAPRAGTSLFHGVFADTTLLERVLSAPVVEIVEISPKDRSEVAQTKLQELLARMEKVTNSGGKESAAVAGISGPVHERKGDWVALIGWPSVEAHGQDVRDGPMGGVVKELVTTCKVKLGHAKLRRHGGAKL